MQTRSLIYDISSNTSVQIYRVTIVFAYTKSDFDHLLLAMSCEAVEFIDVVMPLLPSPANVDVTTVGVCSCLVVTGVWSPLSVVAGVWSPLSVVIGV